MSRPVDASKVQPDFRTRSLGGVQSRASLGSASGYGSVTGGRYVSRSGTRSSGLGPSLEGSLYSNPSMYSSDSLYGSSTFDLDRPPGLHRSRSIEELLDKYAPLPIPKKGSKKGRSTGSLDRLGRGNERLKLAIAYSSANVGASPVLSPTQVSYSNSTKSKSSICLAEPFGGTTDVVEDVFSTDDDNNVLNLEGYGAYGTESSTDFDTELHVSPYYSQPDSAPVQDAFNYRSRAKRPAAFNFDLLSSKLESASQRSSDEARTADREVISGSSPRSYRSRVGLSSGTFKSENHETCSVAEEATSQPSPSGSLKSLSSGPRTPTGSVISFESLPRSPTTSIRSHNGFSRSPNGSIRSVGSQSKSPTHSSQQQSPVRSPNGPIRTQNIPSLSAALSENSPGEIASSPSKIQNVEDDISSSSRFGSMYTQRTPFLYKYSSAGEFAYIHSKLSQNIVSPTCADERQDLGSSNYRHTGRRPIGSLDTASERFKDILGSDCHEEYISTDYLEFSISPKYKEPPPSPTRDIRIIKTNTPRNTPPLSPSNKSTENILDALSSLGEEISDELASKTSNLHLPETRERIKSGGSDSAINLGTSLSDDEHRALLQGLGTAADTGDREDLPDSAVCTDESSVQAAAGTSQNTYESSIGAKHSVFKHVSESEHFHTDSQDSSASRPRSPRIPFSKVQTPSFTKIIHPPPSVVISDHSHDDLPSPNTPEADNKDSAEFRIGELTTENLLMKKRSSSIGSSLSDLSGKSDTNLDPAYNRDRRYSERRLSFSSTTSERSDSIKSGLSDSSYSIDDEDLDFIPHKRKLSASVS